MARIDPKFGMLVPDSRFVPVNQESVGVSAVLSAYTQAGPQPGTPVLANDRSSWRPFMANAQSSDIELQTIRGGFADSARVVYRISGQGALARRGWDEPSLLLRPTSPLTGTDWSTGNYAAAAICAIPQTGEVVVVVAPTPKMYRYNPRSETWSADLLSGSPIRVVDEQLSLVWDDKHQRLVLFSGEGGPGSPDCQAYYSDDYGDTWFPYALGYWSVDQNDGGRMSVATSESAWVAFTGDDDISQWISTDYGATWEQVNRITSFCEGQQFDVVALRDGGFVLVYLVDVGGFDTITVRRIGSAAQNFGDAEVISTNETASTVAASVDDDGLIYIYAQKFSGDDLIVLRSADGGVTWERYGYDAIGYVAGDTGGTANWRAVSSCGQTHCVITELAGLWDSSITAPFSLLSFGGWSNVEGGSIFASFDLQIERPGWGDGSSRDGRCWIPVALPDAGVGTPWDKTGTGNIDLTKGCFGEIDTSAAQLYYEETWTNTGHQCGQLFMQHVSGGSASTNEIAAVARAADGITDYRAAFRFTATTITVFDVHGSTPTTTSVDTTNGVYVRWMIASSSGPGSSAWVSAWYKLPGTTQWLELADKMSLTDTSGVPQSQDGLAWGNIAVGTAVSRWAMVGYASDGTWHYGTRTTAQLASQTPRSAGEPIGLTWGHSVPPRGTGGYPIPDATISTENLGRVAASGGPALIVETVTLPVGYQYPAEAVYCTESPSPSRRWESTDDSEVRWVWDLGVATWTGDAVGVAIVEAYARQWTLEYSVAGSSWVTAGTLDLAIGTGLSYTRVGNTVVPRTGTTDITRYIAEGELVGGYVILPLTLGGSAAYRIAANSGGYWTDDAVQRVRIRLEGDASGTDTASTGDIIAPSGVLVAYPTSQVVARYWRVKAAASQVTPGGVYRAGLILPGRVVGLGAEPGWDYSHRMELSRRVNRLQDGTPEIEELAPPRRVWSYGWTDGLVVRDLRAKANGGDWADYVATSAGLPIGTAEDPAYSLWGLLEHALESGSTPCVLLSALPSSTASITDPSLWHYGVLMSEALGVVGVVGDEGVSEVVRLDSVTFESIR